MSTKLKHQAAGGESNVISMNKCTEEGCSKRADLMTFCNEHYAWFKYGLITKEGKHPVDFDKKLQAYKKTRAA
jgi:hypothetical protein